jgi:hypothetical protein
VLLDITILDAIKRFTDYRYMSRDDVQTIIDRAAASHSLSEIYYAQDILDNAWRSRDKSITKMSKEDFRRWIAVLQQMLIRQMFWITRIK